MQPVRPIAAAARQINCFAETIYPPTQSIELALKKCPLQPSREMGSCARWTIARTQAQRKWDPGPNWGPLRAEEAHQPVLLAAPTPPDGSPAGSPTLASASATSAVPDRSRPLLFLRPFHRRGRD